jgi:hypothetical protein
MAGQASDNNERVLRARMAAHLLHAQISDPTEHTEPARAAFLSRFEREVDPEGILEPQERARRAEHAKKAYFIKLALASRKARAAKRRANTDRSPDAGHDDGGQA